MIPKNFNQIDFRCIKYEPDLINDVFLRPIYPIKLDESLTINSFSNMKIPTKKILMNANFFFHNLNGIQVNSRFLFDPLLKIYNYRNIYLQFHDSLLLSKGECSLDQNETGLFRNVSSINIAHTVKYFPNTNPCLFQNSFINELVFYGLASNFFKNNIITFNSSQNSNLNSNIEKLGLYFFKGILTENTLDPFVFIQLKTLTLSGILDKIAQNALKNLHNLSLITFKIEKFLNFLENGISWMHQINSDLNINPEETSNFLFNLTIIKRVKKIEFQSAQTLTNEKFCLFKTFPHYQLIAPLFSKDMNYNCSCTVLWLVKYNLFILDKKEYSSYQFCAANKTSLRIQIEICDFENRLNLCNKSSYYVITPIESQIETLYFIELFDYIILLSYPVVFTLAISSNSFNILVLKEIITDSYKSEVKNSKKSLIFLMLLNSILNFSYVIVRLMHLMNKCVSQNSKFCSKISHTISIQYFDVLFVDILGNIIKFLSNLTLLIISLQRMFLLRGKKTLFGRICKTLGLILTIFVPIISSLEKIINPGINFDDEMLNDFNVTEDFLPQKKKTYFANIDVCFFCTKICYQ
ncbi:unnamed protein product [Brachionus calyciflorus]|uniref:Uncharacterized protein n=1 Tax=Brachionus calyciflorus TaxID=104777 RepID=A0A813M6W2_9BILA|nr:unnamed protein product [Brachionus calyciflorus]